MALQDRSVSFPAVTPIGKDLPNGLVIETTCLLTGKEKESKGLLALVTLSFLDSHIYQDLPVPETLSQLLLTE